MERLSKRLNQSANAQAIPEELVKVANEASRKIKDPEKAKEAFDRLVPVLESFAPNQEFTMACGMLAEKQRNVEGMLDLWQDLSDVFPEDMTPLRMMMRWYRRHRRTSEGLDRIHSLFPNSHTDLEQAEKAAIGFAELKQYDEIDSLMQAILPKHPKARSLRMRYIRVLNDQSRYLEAKAIGDTVQSPQRLGQSSQELLNLVERRAHKMQLLYSSDASDVFEKIISKIEPTKVEPKSALGAITFFTGQLGAGGAERQMTRIATAFQKRYQSGQTAGGLAIGAPIDVALRHASPSSGGDFFLPNLKEARIRTTILAEEETVELHELDGISAEILSLLELLPEDIFDHTRKLIPYFRARKTQIAYLWQDGGVLSAAVAALIAGVTRIVTSFRGLPPNLRPELFRPELAPLYKCLAKLPQVTFSANSQSTATAYEDWLNLSKGEVKVILNASPEILPDGVPQDHELWEKITSQSPRCTKTVIGIFRFNENKRPDLWVEVAAQQAIRDTTTRFILIGNGYMQAQCQKRIAELGFKNRIFLIGLQNNVGFFLHKSDLLMHLARMEGLPNVLIEAQLAGLPVLATPAGGTDEVVTHNLTGHILPSASDPTIRETLEALTQLLNDPSKLWTMGKTAKELAEPRFLIEQVVDRTSRLFANQEDL